MAVALTVLVSISVWPFRSRHLFSWDSANYAFAVSHIDIGLHRPHPPGYLGYVFAGRAIDRYVHDVNAALIAWNIVALSAAAVLTWSLARSAGTDAAGSLAAAVLLVTSPLIWFYASVAEIYVSEMLCAVAIASASLAAVRGRHRALSLLAAAMAAAVLFKLTVAMLMLPLAAYASFRAPPEQRRPALLVLLGLIAAVGAVFFTIQPDLPRVVWSHFTSATQESRLLASPDPLLALNRNARDTLVAFLSAFGLVNTAALLWWLAVDRRLAPIDWRLAVLWSGPWFAELILVHIGKPGYVLPLIPLTSILIAAAASRRGVAVLAGFTAAQAVVNLLWVALVAPGVSNPAALAVKYQDKPLIDKLASDLEPLTLVTQRNLTRSDRRIEELLTAGRACLSGEWVVVAGTDPIDWRRAMFYLPAADAVHLGPDRLPRFTGRNGYFNSVPTAGRPIASACGLLWLSEERPEIGGSQADRVEHIGWRLPPGSGVVTPEGITWTPR